MAASPGKSRPTTSSSNPSLSITQAKATLSSLISGVQKKRDTVTILRRGVPVAQIVPFSGSPARSSRAPWPERHASIEFEFVHLPKPMHKDPADRILVASARIERLTLVTSDKAILSFAKATSLSHLRA